VSELDDLVKFLESRAVRTASGSFIPTDEVRKYFADKKGLEDTASPAPKTMVQAKQQAARDENIFPQGDAPIREAGRAIGANSSIAARA
jgi:hypothetical protein